MSTACIDALVGNATAPFSQSDLLALIGVFGATPVKLHPEHPLFARLEMTFQAAHWLEVAGHVVKVCVLLATESAHRARILVTLDKFSNAFDTVLSMRLSSSSPGKGSVLQVDPSTLEFFSDALLAMVLATGCTLKGEDALELFSQRLDVVVHASVLGLSTFVGARPGVSSYVQGKLQLDVVGNLIALLRGLSSWKSHEAMLAKKGRGKQHTERDLPMKSMDGAFRHHVGEVIRFLLGTTFFVDLRSFTATFPWQEANLGQEKDEILRESLLLTASMFAFTDQSIVKLRKHLLTASTVEHIFVPYLQHLQRNIATTSKLALLSLCCQVVATACWCSKGYVSRLSAPIADAIQFVALYLPPEVESRTKVEVVTQLTRLVINIHHKNAAKVLLDMWATKLSPEEKVTLARRLANPMTRQQPIDLQSPCYDTLRKMFALTDAPPVAKREGGDAARKGHTSTKARTQGRAQTKLKPRHSRNRERYTQIQTMKAKGGAAGTSGSAEGDEDEKIQRMWENMSNGSDDGDEVPALGDVVAPSAHGSTPGVDLSRWRTGPRPENVPRRYLCALSRRLIMTVPVLTPQGITFDEKCIREYFDITKSTHCPISGERLYAKDLLIDTELKKELDRVRLNFINA